MSDVTHFELVTELQKPTTKLVRQLIADGLKNKKSISEVATDYVFSLRGVNRAGVILPWGATDGTDAAVKLMTMVYECLSHELDKMEDPYRYTDFVTRHEVGLIMGGVIGYRSSTAMAEAIATGSAEINRNWHILCHAKAGNRVYQVSTGLAYQLRDTELRGLKTDDLRLPYEAIYVQMPNGLGFSIWNKETGWHRADGIYIVEEKNTGAGRAWRLLFVGGSKDPTNLLDDALIYFTIRLPEGKSVDAIIDEETNSIRAHALDKTALGPMVETWQALFRWVINVMIYATWPDAEHESFISNKEARQLWERVKKLPKGPKRDGLKKQFKATSSRERIRLGGSVVYIDRAKAEQLAATGTSTGAKAHIVAVRVQGHWKMQSHGLARSLRKRLWVAPYWRNADGDTPIGQAIHHLGRSSTSTKPSDKSL